MATGSPLPDGCAAADWQLWSTDARLIVTDERRLAPALRLAHEALAGIERAVSRFHTGSELRTLNAGARDERGVRTLEIGPVFADLLEEALLAAERTGGSVDPTIGRALEAAGYDRDIAVVRRDGSGATVSLQPATGWQRVQVRRSAAGATVRLPYATRLDLGATAKAAAADRCAQLIAERLDAGCLMSLGGDIATAGAAPEGGWQVSICDHPSDPPASVTLAADAGLATSSIRHRAWRRGLEPAHHLLDPATGAPARTPWAAVSVVAVSCVEANTASTASLVRGARGLDWLAATGLPARLVSPQHRVRTVGGWPVEEVAA